MEIRKFWRILSGGLCVAIAGLLGGITVFWVGPLIYETRFAAAIAAGAFGTDPLAEAENFGESLRVLATSFMHWAGRSRASLPERNFFDLVGAGHLIIGGPLSEVSLLWPSAIRSGQP